MNHDAWMNDVFGTMQASAFKLEPRVFRDECDCSNKLRPNVRVQTWCVRGASVHTFLSHTSIQTAREDSYGTFSRVKQPPWNCCYNNSSFIMRSKIHWTWSCNLTTRHWWNNSLRMTTSHVWCFGKKCRGNRWHFHQWNCSKRCFLQNKCAFKIDLISVRDISVNNRSLFLSNHDVLCATRWRKFALNVLVAVS